MESLAQCSLMTNGDPVNSTFLQCGIAPASAIGSGFFGLSAPPSPFHGGSGGLSYSGGGPFGIPVAWGPHP